MTSPIIVIPFNAEITYEFWDSNTCIYVGHSHNFFRRLNKHWWEKMSLGDRVQLKIYPTHEEALAVERFLIETYRPCLNIKQSGSRLGRNNPNSRVRKIDRKRLAMLIKEGGEI